MTEEISLELQNTGGNTAGFQIPDALVERLGGGKKPKVTVTVGTFTYRSSIARMGGEFWLGVSAERRAESNLAPGKTYDLAIDLDNAPRTVEVPEDLAMALVDNAAAKAAWDALSYSNQRRHAESITAAKKAETRERRVAKVVDELRG